MLIYYASSNKYPSFKVSNDILNEEANNELQKTSLIYLEYIKQQALSNLLKAKTHEIYYAKKSIRDDSIGTLHICKDYFREIELSKHFKLFYTVSGRLYTLDPQHPYAKGCETTKSFIIKDGDSILFQLPAEAKKFNILTNIKNNLFEGMNANTESEILDAFDTFDKKIESQKKILDEKIHNLMVNKANLNITHFIFFSASIMTTVGSNDITPNSSIARYIVILQSVVAIFFIGFALDFIWKNRG